MAERLELQVGANIQGLERGLQKAKGEIKGFEQATNVGAKGIDKMGKSTSNAVPALTSFSQVIQDAPYGIRGVANNITQLTSQMGYLSKSAGGTGAALKLMLGTLAGPAGILLVVSLVTSAMVSFGSSMGGAKNKADELKKKLDELNDSFGIELGYNKEVEKSLKLQGKAITDNLNERKKIINSQIDSISLLIKEQQELLNVQKEANEIVSTWELITGTSKNAWGQYKSWWLSNFNKFKSDVKLDEYQAWWEKNFKKGANLLGIDTTVDPASAAELEKQRKLEEQLKELETQRLKLSNQKIEIDKEITKELGKQVSRPKETVSDINQLIPSTQSIDLTGIKTSFEGMKQVITDNSHIIQAQMIALSESMSNIVNTNMASVFSGLGTALGQALATGGNVVGALGNELLQGMGRFLSEMGDLLIQYGIFAKVKGKLDAAIAAGGPASIAAGIAAVAVGVALKAAAGAIGSRSSSGFSGGSVGGVGSSYSGNNYSSTSYGGGFSGGEQRVVFVVRGDALYGVLNNYAQSNGRIGDTEGLISTG